MLLVENNFVYLRKTRYCQALLCIKLFINCASNKPLYRFNNICDVYCVTLRCAHKVVVIKLATVHESLMVITRILHAFVEIKPSEVV